jgi:phosphoribosylamine-glycine ligase
MKPSVLILGGGTDQKLLVEEFNNRGYYTIIVDYYDNPPAKEIADKHYKESTYDENKIKAIAIEHKVSIITTISTDQPLYYAAKISEELGLDCYISTAQALKLTNKFFMKPFLKKYGIPTASFICLQQADYLNNEIDTTELNYPLIVKPADSSGSRGISKVNEKSELKNSIINAYSISRSKEIIIEEYIDGIEVSVDCMVVGKECKVLMISDNHKFLYNGIPLIGKSTYPSQISNSARIKIEKTCQVIATAYQLSNSPLFVQLLVKNDEIFVIELSARIAGGSKPVFYNLTSGNNLVKYFADLLLEKKTIIKKSTQSMDVLKTAVFYLYCQEGLIHNIVFNEKLLKDKVIEKIVLYKSNGDYSKGILNSASRVACAFIKGKNNSEIDSKFDYFKKYFFVFNEENNNLLHFLDR